MATGPSPFNPGFGTVPDFIADRDTEMGQFEQALDEAPDRAHNFSITGLRGVGKTVLIKEYERMALNAHGVVVREDWSVRYRKEPAFARRIVTDLEVLVGQLSVGKKLAKGARTVLQNVKGELAWELGDGVKMTMGASSAPSEPFEDRMSNALFEVGNLALKSGRFVLLLYDEAHTVRDSARTEQFPLNAFLGAVVKAQDDDLPIVLGLCGLPLLSTNLRKARTHSERLFTPQDITNLPTDPGPGGRPSAGALALIEPAKSSRVGFDPATAERIANDVDGYPFFIQKYGDQLWRAAAGAGLAVVDDEVYESQRHVIQDALDAAFYEGRFLEAQRADQQTLRLAGSLGGETFTLSEVHKLRPDRKYGGTQSSLTRLVTEGIIYNARYSEYAYAVPRFGDFLRRKHPHDELLG